MIDQSLLPNYDQLQFILSVYEISNINPKKIFKLFTNMIFVCESPVTSEIFKSHSNQL